MSQADPILEDAGFTPKSTELISVERARFFAECIDVDPLVLEHGVLPALWHWACFVPHTPTSGLGPDGHPPRRTVMDAFPQRMWIGGRVHINEPLALGAEATRFSRIHTATAKSGTAGPFWLVTVQHEITQHGDIRVLEQQDLAFRQPSTLAPPGPDRDDPPDADWVEEMRLEPVHLFRFSAVTNNAHRIHYDHPYATMVEGYPDLVVHGPLTAVLLAEFARRHTGRDATEISFRARAPHFANKQVWLTGHSDTGGVVRTAAIRSDHAEAMTLETD